MRFISIVGIIRAFAPGRCRSRSDPRLDRQSKAVASWIRGAVILVFSFLLTANLVADTGAGTISGSIFAVDGARLPGAIITLANQETGSVFRVTASERGLYRATGLPAGRYEMRTELIGFKPYVESDVELTEGGSRAVDVTLSVALTVNEVVTVIGEVPSDSLESTALRESPARDVGEALAGTAGVWKVRKGGIANDVVLRGFQAGDLNVFIDGQRLYGACPNRMDPASFHVDFSEVDRIEVGKGPFDMKNQGSLGGAINIVTRKPEEGWHVSGNVTTGSYAFINPSATVSYGGRSFSALGGYSYRVSNPYTDGSGRPFTDLTNYKPGSADENAFEIGTAWGRLGWTPVPGHQLQLSYTRQDADHIYYPYLRMDAVYDDTDRLNVRYDAENLSSTQIHMTAQGYFNRVNHWMTDGFRTSSAMGSRGYSMGTMADTKTFGGKLEFQILQLTFGAEAFDRFWGATTEMAGMQYRPQFSIPDVTVKNLGFYAEYDQEIAERLSLSLGARIDRTRSIADPQKAATNLYVAYQGTDTTSAEDTFPSGKIRLAYTIAAGLKIEGGIGHTARAPEAAERYFGLKRMGADWVGNPGLAPSRNTGVDVALSYERSGLYIGGNLHSNRVQDYIAVYDQNRVNNVPGVMNTKARSYANIDADLWGAELDAVASLTDRLFLSGDVSFIRGTQTPVPELDIYSENLAEIPPLRSRLQLRYDNGSYFWSAEGVFSSAQDHVNTDLQEEETPGYATANLRLGIRRDRFLITVGLDNVLDKAYFEHLSYYRDPFRSGVRILEPGRNFFVNVGYRF